MSWTDRLATHEQDRTTIKKEATLNDTKESLVITNKKLDFNRLSYLLDYLDYINVRAENTQNMLVIRGTQKNYDTVKEYCEKLLPRGSWRIKSYIIYQPGTNMTVEDAVKELKEMIQAESQYRQEHPEDTFPTIWTPEFINKVMTWIDTNPFNTPDDVEVFADALEGEFSHVTNPEDIDTEDIQHHMETLMNDMSNTPKTKQAWLKTASLKRTPIVGDMIKVIAGGETELEGEVVGVNDIERSVDVKFDEGTVLPELVEDVEVIASLEKKATKIHCKECGKVWDSEEADIGRCPQCGGEELFSTEASLQTKADGGSNRDYKDNKYTGMGETTTPRFKKGDTVKLVTPDEEYLKVKVGALAEVIEDTVVGEPAIEYITVNWLNESDVDPEAWADNTYDASHFELANTSKTSSLQKKADPYPIKEDDRTSTTLGDTKTKTTTPATKSAPAPDKPKEVKPEVAQDVPQEDLEGIVRRRTELVKKLEALDEHLAELRKEAEASLKELKDKTAKEEPILVEALRKMDEQQMIVDEWVWYLKHIKEQRKFKYGKILEQVEEATKDTDQKVYELIQELKSKKELYTDVPYHEELQYKRPKVQTWLVRAEEQGFFARITDWLKNTFTPVFEAVNKGFAELTNLYDVVNADEA